MTKRKESVKEMKLKNKVLCGKVSKNKLNELVQQPSFTRKLNVKLHPIPLGLHQQKPSRDPSATDSIPATPYIAKGMSKCTSTPISNPLIKISRSGRPIKQTFPYNAVEKAASRIPLSPILADIANTAANRGRNVKNHSEVVVANANKENVQSPPKNAQKFQKETHLPSTGQSLELKTLTSPNDNNKKREVITKRKSIGFRKLANSSPCEHQNQYGGKNCSRLRVLVARSVIHPSNRTVSDVAAPNTTTCDTVNTRSNRRKASLILGEPKNDHTLVKQLRADWSGSTFEETPTQLVRDNGNPKRPLKVLKRKLAPLIEVSADENTFSKTKSDATSILRTTKVDDNEYSSSAEFESEDEKENSRSKRAISWKNLSNRTLTPNQLATNGFKKKLTIRLSHKHFKIPTLDTTKADDFLLNTSNANQVESYSELRQNESEHKVIKEKKDDQQKEKMTSKRSKAIENETSEKSEKKLSRIAEENGEDSKHITDDANATESTASPSSRFQNLLNKSNEIEQILSSSAAEHEEETVVSKSPTNSTYTSNVNNANCSKKFFHSRLDSNTALPKTIESNGVRRTSARKKKQEKIYEFLSQSSSDIDDPVADIIQKMINNGKVTLAKHKKGTGKTIVPRTRRKVAAKKNVNKVGDVFTKSKPILKQHPLQEKVVNSVRNDDDLHFQDAGVLFSEAETKRDERGFSYLARSAMIKQAGKNDVTAQRKMITDRKKLLAMAHKFVGQSTPVKIPSLSTSTNQFSPIMKSASPWRVENDNLPNVFYFSRNSENLPSFSSDHIPETPTKNKSKSTSSFSSNDSNMENIAPPNDQTTANENHIQTSSNIRRALNYRSPLKPINISEIIIFPSLTMDNTGKATNNENSKKSVGEASNDNETSLFGFADMIDDDENDSKNVTLDLSAIHNKQHLKEHLHRLKRLRPNNPVATTSKNNRIKPVFDDERTNQKTLKQMFCSTMIEKQQQSEPTNDNILQESYSNDRCDIGLFKDPETTFNESNPRRTYSRPFKKKRKLRHSFVMFMDSDASDSEDEEKAKKKYEKKSKKRQIREPKENAELNKFVDEFKEMCQEVSEYELIVE